MNKKKLLLLILGLLIVLGASGGGWYWWMRQEHPLPVNPHSNLQSMPLGSFVVTVMGKHGMSHYLVVGMTVSVQSAQAIAAQWQKAHTPQMRAAVLDALLSMKNLRQVVTSATTRVQMHVVLTKAINSVLPGKPYFATVRQIYVTKLMLQ
ncbi:flagellar basal body-associated FliL family protein [Acidithiobacillus ferrivorans]|nr:flagellar basal body-associated FliL family protein [Acidithiobacillus ferrivorans]